MKTIVLSIMLCISMNCFSQTYKFYQTQNYHNQLRLNTKTGEVMQIQDDGGTWYVSRAITPTEDIQNRYILEPTRNYWTYIMLDTFSGKLWQCQFSVQGDEYIFTVPINTESLSYTKSPKFEISPMTSMYQFYLTNGDTGELWQFQWTNQSDSSYRWIQKIR